MNYYLSTNRKGIDVHLKFEAKNPCQIISTAYSLNSGIIFCERNDIVDGAKNVILKLPVSPEKLIVNVRTNIPGNLRCQATPVKLRTYDVNMGKKDWEFVRFAESFCLGMLLETIKPSEYILKSPSGEFKIVLQDGLKDYFGNRIQSPCQIGSKTGIIEVDRLLLSQYTFAGQMALLCHEYAHFYKNPLHGVPADSEEGADKYGLCVYLGAGYGESEYVKAFKETFKRVDTQQNRNRIKLMMSFACEINAGKIFGKPY